ncbi:MAG TPA: hypothetical protein QF626_02505 [Prochlorococcaceae cyanobacterium Fu_MAG_50]|nr:hypothetical protein [Prochlorococcaceae cyanobacterium Fu_MAG_50]
MSKNTKKAKWSFLKLGTLGRDTGAMSKHAPATSRHCCIAFAALLGAVVGGIAVGFSNLCGVTETRVTIAYAQSDEFPTIDSQRYQFFDDCTKYGCKAGNPCIVDVVTGEMVGKGGQWQELRKPGKPI